MKQEYIEQDNIVDAVNKMYKSVPDEVIKDLRLVFTKWTDPCTNENERDCIEKYLGKFILELHRAGYYTQLFSRAYLAIIDVFFKDRQKVSTRYVRDYPEFCCLEL